MKLLDKLAVNISKSLERKLDVDEGRKLAERIDALRKLAADEETSIAKFREANVNAAKKEIEIFIQRRDAIKEEIAVLEKQRDNAMIPVIARTAALDLREIDLNIKEENVLQKQLDTGEKLAIMQFSLNKAESYMATAKTREAEAERLQSEANTRHQEAEKFLIDAESIYESATEQANGLAADIQEKENKLAEWAKEVDRRVKHAADEDKRLSLRERAIIDREEQLVRELKRRIK